MNIGRKSTSLEEIFSNAVNYMSAKSILTQNLACSRFTCILSPDNIVAIIIIFIIYNHNLKVIN